MAVRSDLDLETASIGRDDGLYEQLVGRDNARNVHARTYFFRGTLRSLYSAHRQLSRLTALAIGPEFRELAIRCGRWEEFVALRRQVGRQSNQFDGARNRFGAHAEQTLEATLDNVETGRVVGASLTDDGRLGVEWGTEAFMAAMSAEAGGPTDENVRALIETI